ncbi:MAG: hypothetical protein JXP39_08885 [Spirochaetales bacterium]|nr:hypothetical protein [Spirochaetales bacterium]
MKKSLMFLLVVCAVSALPLFALNEDVVVWENMYRIAETDEQRLEVVRKITEFKDSEFTPVLVEALENLAAAKIESGNAKEQYARNQLARILVGELGNLKALEADSLVYRVYTEVEEPVLKSEAAFSLGKMQAVDFAGYLASDLISINLSPVPSIAKNQEIIAAGLVRSLASMRVAEGYEAVFLASIGWYSAASPVKTAARAAVVEMVDDPSDSLLKILDTHPDTEVKQAALETCLASKAPVDKKAAVAARALRLGIDRLPPDLAGKAALSRLRLAAMAALAKLQDKNPENAAVLIEVVKADKKDDGSLNETLNAYAALGVNGSDPAAKFIAENLARFNEMQKVRGNTARDKILVKQLVQSAGATKNPLVKPALQQVGYVEHDAGITRLAEDVLKDFGK